MYQISASYCTWPGSLILFKFQPSQGIGLSWVLRLRMGGGGVNSLAREVYIPNLSHLLCLDALDKFLVVG